MVVVVVVLVLSKERLGPHRDDQWLKKKRIDDARR